MSKAYFFGDSFIFGYGCRPGDKFYESSNEPDKRTMPQIVSSYLGAEFVYKTGYGYSNEAITYSIIELMSSFEKGDYVLMFGTHSTKNIFMGDDKEHVYYNWPDQLKFIIDPVKADEVREPWFEFKDKFYSYWQNIYKGIESELKLRGVKAYYYTSGNNWYKDYDMREEDKIKNEGHWNFKGHKKAANWVIGKIKKENELL